MSKWPLVPLSSLLTERQEVPSDDDLASGEIPIVAKIAFDDGRIQLRAEGETKTGMILIRPGDLVVSGINAAKGAIAVYGEDNTRPIAATIHYGAYIPKKERVDISFLWWLLRSRTFKSLLLKYVPGGVKTELKSKRLLPIPIPLPPLTEQRRIVAQIEALAAKIEVARDLRQQAMQDEERLLICMAHREDLLVTEKIRSGWFETTVGSICRFTDESESVDGSRSYPNLGIYSYGRGVFPKPPIEGAATSAHILRRVRAGQFIYSRLFAFEGSYAMVPPDLDGHYVSGEYPTFTCDPTKACAEFLWAHFRSPNVWQTVAAGSKGLGNRRQRVQPDRVLEYSLWVPPMEWQRKIQSVQSKVDALKKLQDDTAAELNALLPSILDKAFKGEL